MVDHGALTMPREGGVTAHDAWRRLCRAARPHITPALFRACFAGTLGVELSGDTLVVVAPNATA